MIRPRNARRWVKSGRGGSSPPPPPPPSDTTPDPFTFDAIDNALPGQSYSRSIVVTGINAPAAISASGGLEYRIDGGAWTSAAGTVSNDAAVDVRLSASADYAAEVSGSLTIGGVSASFAITTQVEPAASPATLPVNYPVYSTSEPRPALTAQTATITTTSGLQAVLSNAAASGVYYLAPGDYSQVSCNVYHTNRLILRPADPANPPRFIRADGSASPVFDVTAGSGNVWLDGLRFEAARGNAYRTNPIVNLVECSNVRVSRSVFRGKMSTDNVTFEPAGGWTSTGIAVKGASATIIDHCDFSEIGKGVVPMKNGSTRAADTVIVANDFTKISEDAIVFQGVDRLMIRYNRMKTFRPGPGMHNDSRQGLVLFSGDEASDITDDFNFTWNDVDCLFVDSAGVPTATPAWMQCAFYSDGTTLFPSFTRLYIADNIMCAPGNWQVRVRGGQDVLIARNRGYRSDRSAYDGLKMLCHAANCDNVAMIDNVAQEYSFTATDGAAASGKPHLSTNTTSINNSVDMTEYSESYFATLETAWLAARTAAGH